MPGVARRTGTSEPAATSSSSASPPSVGATLAAVVPGGSIRLKGTPAAALCGASRCDQATMLSIRVGKPPSCGRFDSEGSKEIVATGRPPSIPEAISGPSELQAMALNWAGSASRCEAPAPIVSDARSTPSSSGLAASVPLMRLSCIFPRSCAAGEARRVDEEQRRSLRQAALGDEVVEHQQVARPRVARLIRLRRPQSQDHPGHRGEGAGDGQGAGAVADQRDPLAARFGDRDVGRVGDREPVAAGRDADLDLGPGRGGEDERGGAAGGHFDRFGHRFAALHFDPHRHGRARRRRGR